MFIGFGGKWRWVNENRHVVMTTKNLNIFFIELRTFFSSTHQNIFATSSTHVVCKNCSEMLDSDFNTCNL